MSGLWVFEVRSVFRLEVKVHVDKQAGVIRAVWSEKVDVGQKKIERENHRHPLWQ